MALSGSRSSSALIVVLSVLLMGINSADSQSAETIECTSQDTTFELRTGYVFTAPEEILDTRPDTLQLADCIETCRLNSSCSALNFETGLCVLFRTNAFDTPEALTKSQFPVYTIYAQRICLANASELCAQRSWAYEMVPSFEMSTFVRQKKQAATRRACMELCLNEQTFQCRSASFSATTGECSLSDMDRFSVTARSAYTNTPDVDYFETNCVDDPVKMCDFQRTEGRILKTVDAVFQDVETEEACKNLCLNANFRCHSFDFGDTGDKVCRLSHHSASSLSQIQDPYLEIPEATTHELTSCYNVTIDCRSSDMIVRVKTNRIFSGKLYAKERPNSCVTDVTRGLEFELRLGYQDLGCDVKQEGLGKFFTEVVIQHHDQIVTSQDVGLALRCSYQLQNYTLTSGLDLSVASRVPTIAEESTVVPGPTVVMKIAARQGGDIQTAQVGDPLSLFFEIQEPNSPYSIFVRELIATDGIDNSEILLIDSNGCPTDQEIMGPINVLNGTSKVLRAPFDAFKFPNSDVVQFKAIVTPCLPTCEPVQCDVQDYLGYHRKIESMGKRRRRRSDAASHDPHNLLVVQSIRIADKFQAVADASPAKTKTASTESEVAVLHNTDNVSQHHSNVPPCLNLLGLLMAGALFLVAQAVLIGAWAFIWQKRRQTKMAETTIESDRRFFSSTYANNAYATS
ncbi:uncharacterized protein LOC116925414 [Daphnia magna]|nr:uncharacterized protein LOC116925414 [Daphnia magna]KAK4015822.1 hypothetical protein OUZ56_030795 [Daphnia magna]